MGFGVNEVSDRHEGSDGVSVGGFEAQVDFREH